MLKSWYPAYKYIIYIPHVNTIWIEIDNIPDACTGDFELGGQGGHCSWWPFGMVAKPTGKSHLASRLVSLQPISLPSFPP